MPDAAPSSNPLKPKSKNQRYLLIAGLGAGGIVGYIWYRKRQASNAATANSTSTGVDPNAIDPNTGIPYADEATYQGASGSTPGALGTYNPLTGQYTPGYGTGIPPVTVPASNSQWSQAALTALEGAGFDATSTATALGLYLAGQPLTADQYAIVQSGLGLEGQPPTSVPAPQQIAPPTGNSGNGSTGSGNTSSNGTFPQWGDLSLSDYIAALTKAGYSVGNVSYAYKNLTPTQLQQAKYQTDTIYRANVVPGTKTVNIGLE